MIAKKVDANQKLIVQQLRQIGCSVFVTSKVGEGFPDLVVGFRGKNFLIELKDGNKSASRKKLTEYQDTFFMIWQGQVNKAESFNDILLIIQK